MINENLCNGTVPSQLCEIYNFRSITSLPRLRTRKVKYTFGEKCKLSRLFNGYLHPIAPTCLYISRRDVIIKIVALHESVASWQVTL